MDWIIKEKKEKHKNYQTYYETVVEAENEEYIDACLEILQKEFPYVIFEKEKKEDAK